MKYAVLCVGLGLMVSYVGAQQTGLTTTGQTTLAPTQTGQQYVLTTQDSEIVDVIVIRLNQLAGQHGPRMSQRIITLLDSYIQKTIGRSNAIFMIAKQRFLIQQQMYWSYNRTLFNRLDRGNGIFDLCLKLYGSVCVRVIEYTNWSVIEGLIGSYEPQKKENQTDNNGIIRMPYQIAPDVILYTTYLSGSQNIGVVQPLTNQCDRAFDEQKILGPERALCKNYLDRVDISIIR